MSAHWGGPKCGKFYLPKHRIRRKVEKPEYRERYEKQVGWRATYNSLGKLVGVRRCGDENLER